MVDNNNGRIVYYKRAYTFGEGEGAAGEAAAGLETPAPPPAGWPPTGSTGLNLILSSSGFFFTSSLCMDLMCDLRLKSREKALPQPLNGHLKFLSPVWMR